MTTVCFQFCTPRVLESSLILIFLSHPAHNLSENPVGFAFRIYWDSDPFSPPPLFTLVPGTISLCLTYCNNLLTGLPHSILAFHSLFLTWHLSESFEMQFGICHASAQNLHPIRSKVFTMIYKATHGLLSLWPLHLMLSSLFTLIQPHWLGCILSLWNMCFQLGAFALVFSGWNALLPNICVAHDLTSSRFLLNCYLIIEASLCTLHNMMPKTQPSPSFIFLLGAYYSLCIFCLFFWHQSLECMFHKGKSIVVFPRAGQCLKHSSCLTNICWMGE